MVTFRRPLNLEDHSVKERKTLHEVVTQRREVEEVASKRHNQQALEASGRPPLPLMVQNENH